MGRKKEYLILDCETANPKELKEIVGGSEVGTRFPLIYDLAWIISDRNGNIRKRENIIIAEIFYNPDLFNTAYYKEKRPAYIKRILSGEFEILPFEVALNRLIEDCKEVSAVCAYNALFDFRSALPFTQEYLLNCEKSYYITRLKERIEKAVKKEKSSSKKEIPTKDKYNAPYFRINGYYFPMVDIWDKVINELLNTKKYKNWCIDNGKIGKKYFTTNAETVYQYITGDLEFTESHTALHDCEIELQLLLKAIRKKAIKFNGDLPIKSFPMQVLGTVKRFIEGD